MRRAELAKLWILMATGFIDMMGLLMVLPLLPFFAEALGADRGGGRDACRCCP
jgi:hypothetical protein